jgi:AraC-like DNA-binding protein
MICGNFTLSQPLRGRLLELLPPLLLLKPKTDDGWFDAILQRMVNESAVERPGQRVALSRMTEMLFVEVLRCWIKSLRPGEGGWIGAMADPHIGPALQLIHEQLDRPWTVRELGHHVGLGRSAFSARFTKLIGQPVHRYLVARRMAEAAFLLESGDEGIAQIASRVGYETTAAFSKLFHRHHGLSPGRYRAVRRADGG